MSEARYRSTPPRWFDAGISFEEPAAFGNPLPNSPMLSTRILPVRDSHSIPAPVLRDLIDQTQRLVYIAAHTAAYGQNPDFADLRNLDDGLKRVSTLSVSPFEEGSFIIPGELPEEEASVGVGDNQKKLGGFAVLDRFHAMLGTLGGADTNVSMGLPIGFIQTVEEMGKIVGRHASRVEYLADTALDAERHAPVVVEASFISRAVAVHERRKGRPRTGFTRLTGVLVSLDLLRNRAKILVDNEGSPRAVNAYFDESLNESLSRYMGKRITVGGNGVVRRGRTIEIKIAEVKEAENTLF